MSVQKNFVVKNGLEVNNNLIFADKDSNKVGIATTNPQYTLHVNGGIGVTHSVVTGVSTVNNLTIDGRITAGSSLGVSGQYLISTGAGVTWASIPKLRSVDTQTASVGVTTFSTTYVVGLLDVYINGVRLSNDEFTAADSATVTLDDACFGGETVEFVSYSPTSVGAGFTGIQGITILEEGSPVGSALQVTSLNFVGASVTAVGAGYGVTVYVSNSGIATYATYATTAGIATVSEGLTGTPNIEVGIITATNVVIGGGTTQLIVNGDARVTGILTIGTSSITLDGANNTINVGAGVTIDGDGGTITATSLIVGGTTLTGAAVTYITAGSGISVDQSTGNVTITATGGGGGSSQWVSTTAGIHTLSSVGIGTTNPTSKLTVKGNTSLETLSVSGVSTFSYIKNTGITSTQDLIIYGNGNESGSISTVALMSRNNYIDFGPAIENTSAVQQFALRLGSDRAPGTFGVYNILGASWTNPSGSVFLNNWNGTAAIGINDTAVSVTARPLTVGTATSTGTASQTLQVTGGAYVSGSVGIGTTNPTVKLEVNGSVKVGVSTAAGVILTSPNGTKYQLFVENDGTLKTVAV